MAEPQKFEGSLLPRHNLAYPDKNTPIFFKASKAWGSWNEASIYECRLFELLYHKPMLVRKVFKMNHITGVHLSASEHVGSPWLENTTVSSNRQLFLGGGEGSYGEMPESFMMPERLTAIFSTPGVCVILRKHKCITSLWGQDESFSSHQ